MGRPADPKPRLKKGYWTVRIVGKDHHLGKDQRKAFAKFHRLMADRLAPQTGRPQTVNGAIEVWLTRHTSPKHIGRLRKFVKFTGRLQLADVTPDLLYQYHAYLLGVRYQRSGPRGNLVGKVRSYTIATLRNYIYTPASVMRLAADRGWCARVDTPKLAKPGFVNRSTAPCELWERLDAMCKRAERAGRILRFIAATGCRPGEAVRLQWDQVHREHRVCVLPEHKTAGVTGEPRVIALTDDALDVLRETSRTDHPNVFLSRYRKPYTVTGVRTMAVRHLGVTPYRLRHTFAQTAISAGQAPATVTKLLGHKGSDMVWTYAKIRDAQLVEAARNLKLRTGA